MQKQSWWFVGAVAALLAVSVYTLRQPNERGMQRLRFGHVKNKAIDLIELSGATEAVLHKEDGHWLLTNGRRADEGAVARFLAALEDTDLTDFVTSDSDEFTDLGVEGPKATFVKLEAKGREKLAFSFVSADGPDMTSTVLWRGDVFRGQAPFALQAARKEADWLDRHLFDLAEADVDRVAVELHQAPAYVLARDKEGERTWRLEHMDQHAGKKGAFRFDAQAASGLLNVLQSTQLSDFVSPTPTLQESGLSVEAADSWCLTHLAGDDEDAADRAGRTECLRVGKAKGDEGFFAKLDHRDDVFVLPTSQVEGMRRRPHDLRALNTMAGVNFDDVVAGGIERPGNKPMLFGKDAEGWHLISKKPSADFVLDKGKVNALLRKMTFARAIGIAKPNEGRMTPSLGQLWVKTKDGKRHALRFGPAVARAEGTRSFWARGTADDNIYKVSKPLYDEFMAEPKALALPTRNAAAKPSGLPASGSGLDSLPPDVRANIERQLAQQKGQG